MMNTIEVLAKVVECGGLEWAVAKLTKIKDWYMKTYPTDELGAYLNPEATFYGLYETLDNYGDVYEFLGEGDSVVRERCFEKLAEIMDCGYQTVYGQWLLGVDRRR